MGATSIAFAPLLPWLAVALLAAPLAVLLAWALWQRASGTATRAAVGALLVLALLNPSLVNEQREILPDIAVVVVDESASTRIGERARQREAALAAIKARLAEQKNFELRELRAGAADASLAGGEEGTRLFSALERALAEVPRRQLSGVILLTDGQVHDAPEKPDRGAGGLAAPLHALLLGAPGEGDRRLAVVQAPSFGLVGKTVPLKVKVEDNAVPAGTPVRLTVRQEGAEPRAETAPVGGEHTIEIKVDRAGLTVVEIQADAGPRELSLANNRAIVTVSGVRDRLRVLLVSGEPHAGERTWRSLLKSDPSVDLVHFTILRPPEKQDGTPIRELSLIAFPIRELFEVKLDEFDLIIFDRYRRRGVLPNVYLQNIVNYVHKGGALLEAAGPSYGTAFGLFRSPLGTVLPGEPTGTVYDQGFKPKVTEVGKRHPVTAELPGAATDDPQWGRWFRQVEVEALRGRPLMSGVANHPLLLLDRVGQGRVAQVLSDHMWLWARGFEGGGPQAELLRRLAHWLMKEPELEENDLKAAIQGGRLTVTRRMLDPDTATVKVTTPSGAEREVPMGEPQSGRSTGTVPVDEPGIYRVGDGVRTAIAAVGALNPMEFADLRATPDRLLPAVEASHGSWRWLSGAAAASAGAPDLRRVLRGRSTSGRDWIGLVRNEEFRITGILQVPLLPWLLTLALALSGLAFAWWREGK